jgi:hypothetical protein
MATAGALAAASLLTLPGAAHAGFLDFLFGGVQQPAPPVNSYTEPPPPTSSSRRGPDGTREEGGGGGGARYAAYCVRLCDGHPFPLGGRDALGLAPLEATSDPTLRAGDIVATKDGLQAYTGRRGQGAAFSPVDEAAVAAELTRSSSRSQPKRPALSPAAEDEPGATARPDGDAQPDTRGQATR